MPAPRSPLRVVSFKDASIFGDLMHTLNCQMRT